MSNFNWRADNLARTQLKRPAEVDPLVTREPFEMSKVMLRFSLRRRNDCAVFPRRQRNGFQHNNIKSPQDFVRDARGFRMTTRRQASRLGARLFTTTHHYVSALGLAAQFALRTGALRWPRLLRLPRWPRWSPWPNAAAKDGEWTRAECARGQSAIELSPACGELSLERAPLA